MTRLRRTLPLLGQVLAILLVMQWATGAAACLAGLHFDPASVLCHVARDQAPPDQLPQDGDSPAKSAAATCPLCAPLPPGLAPAPVAVAAPRLGPAIPTAAPPTRAAAYVAPAYSPLQPRAPPSLS